MENLVTTPFQSRKLNEMQPHVKTPFSWYKARGVAICGSNPVEFIKDESADWELRETGSLVLGMNFISMRYVDEIVPAYTAQDLVDSFNVKVNVSVDPKQMALKVLYG